jgi:sugar lactone lactonase YvrE
MKNKNGAVKRSIINGAGAITVLFIAATASAQNVFVSNYSNGNIYKITPSGVQSVFASGMDFPDGLAFNSAGDMFVANTANNSGPGYITEITPGGTQSTFASGIDPHGLAFNSSGDLFQVDYDSGNIYEYTPNGVQSTFASGFDLPLSVAINSAGDLFVSDSGGSITEITPNGTESLFASGLQNPHQLAFNSSGDLFETDGNTGNIYEFTPQGKRSTFDLTPKAGQVISRVLPFV